MDHRSDSMLMLFFPNSRVIVPNITIVELVIPNKN
jgi:hypothetical protein